MGCPLPGLLGIEPATHGLLSVGSEAASVNAEFTVPPWGHCFPSQPQRRGVGGRREVLGAQGLLTRPCSEQFSAGGGLGERRAHVPRDEGSRGAGPLPGGRRLPGPRLRRPGLPCGVFWRMESKQPGGERVTREIKSSSRRCGLVVRASAPRLEGPGFQSAQGHGPPCRLLPARPWSGPRLSRSP